MQLYIYAKSGHSFGLENVRRATAISKLLDECNPIVCTADYRAATFAKQNIGLKVGMGIDIVGNLPNVMQRGDMLIYDDSGEASSTMQEHMQEFCNKLYKVGVDIPFEIVDPQFFKKNEIKYEKALFFADDDYKNWFLEFCKDSQQYDIPLVWGHYFFYGNEKELQKSFSNIIEEDDYIDTISSTKYILTASVHTTLESLASGNFPIFFKRDDKQIENFKLLEKYNIPIIEANNLDDLMSQYDEVIKNYPTNLKRFEPFDIEPIKEETNKTLEIFKKIQPSLEYKF